MTVETEKMSVPGSSTPLVPVGIPSKCGDFHYEEMSCQMHEESMTRSSRPVL